MADELGTETAEFSSNPIARAASAVAYDPLIEVDPNLRSNNARRMLPMTSESLDMLGAGEPYPGGAYNG